MGREVCDPAARGATDIQTETLRNAAWVTASPLGEDAAGRLQPPPRPRRRPPPPPAPRRAGRARPTPPSAPTCRSRPSAASGSRGAAGPINGDWLGQRPGQLLKFLAHERRRVVTSDQIGEVLWPEAGPQESSSRLRYNVHALRDKLEPGARAARRPLRRRPPRRLPRRHRHPACSTPTASRSRPWPGSLPAPRG